MDIVAYEIYIDCTLFASVYDEVSIYPVIKGILSEYFSDPDIQITIKRCKNTKSCFVGDTTKYYEDEGLASS